MNFTAEQLLLHVLELIKSTRSASALTMERVSTVMQRPAQSFGPGHFGYGGKVTPEWGYGLDIKKAGSPGARLDLDFIDTTPDQSAPTTEICQIDFDRFSAELTGVGFARETVRGEHGRAVYEQFQGHGLSVIVDRIGDASTPPENAPPACVLHVTVQ